MKISTTIKKKYFDMKMVDLETNGYFYEYKSESPFWLKRLGKIMNKCQGNPIHDTEIVFLVGKTPHRFKVTEIFHTTIIPQQYAEVITTEDIYVIKCERL